jgi:hypothetical protein
LGGGEYIRIGVIITAARKWLQNRYQYTSQFTLPRLATID